MNSEESVEQLIAKLESKGKKIQIIDPNNPPIPEAQNEDEDGNRVSGGDGANDENNGAQDNRQNRGNHEEIENELRNKDQALEQERQEKENLAQLIQEMEKKMVVGG